MINYYWLLVKGKNLKKFLLNLLKQNINIEQIKYKEKDILIKVSYENYKKIKKVKTSYEISIIKTSGTKKVKQLYKKYKLSIFIFCINVFFIILLSNHILFINIETNNNSLKQEVKEELSKNDISLYSKKKSFSKLEKIKQNIKNNKTTSIEWIEFEQKGVVLNVKVIERINKKWNTETKYQDIVASKDGYIRRIVSDKGEILKNIDDYVKKGEVIISGNIFRNGSVVGKVKANGKVYAEVWYIVKTNKNLYYNKLKEKEKGSIKLYLEINNKKIKLFSISKRNVIPKKINLFKTNNFKLHINIEKNYSKTKVKYDYKELIKILELKSQKEIKNTLESDEYIILQKTLKKNIKNDKMYLEVFFKCYEDISAKQDIAKIEEKKEE